MNVNVVLRADYFRTEEVLNIPYVYQRPKYVSVNYKRYLLSVSISAFCLLLYSMVERELN